MTIAIRKPSLGSAATSFLATDHKLFIDGKWVAAKSGQTFPSKIRRPKRPSPMSRPATRLTSTWRSRGAPGF